MARPTMTIRSLKEQAKAREKVMKLRSAVAKMRLKVTRLEHKAERLRTKIQQYEERADRLDQDVIPPSRY
jgi:phage shock protein A